MSDPLVLIADDNEDIVDSHSQLLASAGYRVCTARDGREAIALALTMRPDVILMDLDMPEIDGWEATRCIRADLRTHRIPIIAFTSYGLRRYIDRSFEAGCTAFIDKPCDARALVDEVERALARRPPPGAVVAEAPHDVGSGPTSVTPPKKRRQRR
jgi:two-component system cell cycle response regulator DivK